MNRSLKLSFASLTTLFSAAIVVACSSGAQNDSETSGSDLAATNARMIPSGCNHKKAAVNGHAQASCYSVHLDSTKIDHPAVINGAATTTPSGFGPSDIQSAYNIPSSFAPNSTVAVVDAQDNPNAESDLAVYRAQFGLPACTTANGCFKKVSQTGSTTGLPSGDTDWGGEIALDLDMVSAACPSCKILLVETNSQADTDLAAGVDEAVKLGAQAVSNSYGWSEDSSSSSDATHYTHAGVLVTASAGDSDTGASFPATAEAVTAVGGTSLVKDSSSRGWTETVWENSSSEGTGSGCSTVFAQPSFQTTAMTGCAKRAEADVSAVADPQTGVAVYDTYGGSSAGADGWEVYGGTSASSPLFAALMVRVGKATTETNGFAYANTGDFYDVTSGSNGTCTKDKQICNAGVGWDGPTGIGTPNGTAISGGTTTPPDAGIDSGTDAGKDSGTDSGTDAGKDSGADAGKDSGVDAGKDSGTDAGEGTCSHDVCATGTKLTKTCDTCAGDVCASDSYCCSTKWDDICVSEVAEFCAAGTTSCN